MPYICCMNKVIDALSQVWRFYREGFKGMTWGRTLWVIILIKLFVIFVILRLVFFKPTLEGLSDKEKSEQVGSRLSR